MFFIKTIPSYREFHVDFNKTVQAYLKNKIQPVFYSLLMLYLFFETIPYVQTICSI